MRGKWFVMGAAVVLAAVAAGALWRWRHVPARTEPAPAVVTTAPAPPAEIILSGKIEPQHVTAVGPAVNGTVAEFMADVGQEVYQGEVLARISNPGLEAAQEAAQHAMEVTQARVEKAGGAIIAARLEATRARADAMRARSELNVARRTWERQDLLNREGATPRLTYEKAKRDFEQAQSQSESLENLARVAEDRVQELVTERDEGQRQLEDKARDLEEAKARLAGAEVHSPVDGLVVERKGEVGKEINVQEQAEMFRIAVDLGELQVRVNPDADAIKRLHEGDAALVVLPELGGDGLPAVVKQIAGNQAAVTFTSPNPAIRPGMSAQVRIRPSESPADRAVSAPHPQS